jgi:hypothetical protein
VQSRSTRSLVITPAMLNYDESAIISRLRPLSKAGMAAFAYGCARRTEPLAESPSLAAAIDDALKSLAAVICGNAASAAGVRDALSRLELIEIDSDAHAAASYALRAWLTGQPQEAAWAARRAYEAADQISAVQPELEAQRADLAAVESGNYRSVFDNLAKRDD